MEREKEDSLGVVLFTIYKDFYNALVISLRHYFKMIFTLPKLTTILGFRGVVLKQVHDDI